MPQARYINVTIDDQRVDLQSPEDLGISISYQLEDPDNFQNKKSSESFNVKFPATVTNDQISNTFHNPGIDDLTADNIFDRHRRGLIEGNGIELLVGKAFLIAARHASCPLEYEYNFYGNNGDWMIDLKEKTLFDFLRHISFAYTKDNIIASWDFDGTSEALPYVFAPVRYGLPMEPYYTNLVMDPPPLADDYNMGPTYLKPSISKYWLLYWGFQSLGYRMASDFFDTEYFRRQVMPWTWGNFNSSAGTRLDNLDFLAKSAETVALLDQSYTGFWDLEVNNDSTNGAFDNSGVYGYSSLLKEMQYTYLPQFQYGTLEHHFHLAWQLAAVASNNSDVELRVQYFKNGVKLDNGNDNGNGTLLLNLNAPTIGVREFGGQVDEFIAVSMDPGDVFLVKMYLHTFDSGLGRAQIKATVEAFELEFIRIPLGGTIDFENYIFLNKWKFLDFFKGIIDEFNLSLGTDPVNKVIYIEPTHPYSLQDDQSIKAGGYFNGNYIDWQAKQDLLKTSDVNLFSDSEREIVFKYKNDSGDGCLKLVQDRNVNILAAGKYVLPDRFKAGNKEYENTFFSPTMHYDVVQWTGIGTLATDMPQMIAIVPENIANTSADEAQNTFEPKSCYYKGLTTDWGWVFDTEKTHPFPFMFAVNYKIGGQEDPILSYCDERIAGPVDPYTGSELIINGTFTGGSTGWTLVGDVSYSSNKIQFAATGGLSFGDLQKLAVPLIAGRTYRISFDMSGTVGGIGLSFGSVFPFNAATGGGIVTITIDQIYDGTGGGDIHFQASEYDGIIDNVSIKEIITPTGDPVIGKGLLKRFFHQRLAIMRKGRYYDTWMKLNNIDITNWLHREHIVCRGQKWELVEIKNYNPLAEQTTAVSMRKWTPLTTEDNTNTFPSEDEVLDTVTTAVEFDIPYAQLKCLASDIPK